MCERNTGSPKRHFEFLISQRPDLDSAMYCTSMGLHLTIMGGLSEAEGEAEVEIPCLALEQRSGRRLAEVPGSPWAQ